MKLHFAVDLVKVERRVKYLLKNFIKCSLWFSKDLLLCITNVRDYNVELKSTSRMLKIRFPITKVLKSLLIAKRAVDVLAILRYTFKKKCIVRIAKMQVQ